MVALLSVGFGGCWGSGDAKPPVVVRPEPPAVRWQPPPGEPYNVLITSHEFNWHIRHPGEDGKLETDDDVRALRNLHLPGGGEGQARPCEQGLHLHARLAALDRERERERERERAVPDLSFSIKFQPDEVATYKLLGDQMYGYTHPNLLGTLTVLSRSDFEDWLRERSPKPK